MTSRSTHHRRAKARGPGKATSSPGAGAGYAVHAAKMMRKGTTKTMRKRAEAETDAAEELSVRRISDRAIDLLGGPSIVGRPEDALGAHRMIDRGLPNETVLHLEQSLTTMERASVEQALGISSRTRQRKEKHPTEKLTKEQSGRVWKFAELLSKAMAVFGSQGDAERWFEAPAIALNQERPIDLLSTPAGVELVQDHLERMAYGVYE